MKIDVSQYDLVDFGCSDGASMEFAFKHLGCKTGLGVDIDPGKVEKTRALGYDAVVADLTRSDNFSGRARISILSHVLEHIPDIMLANQILNTATLISSEAVLVRQPWFDSDGLLMQMGVKPYWSDWPGGHTNHMSSLQMFLALKACLDKGQIASFSVWGHYPITSTADECLVPLESRPNRHKYDPEADAPKPEVPLEFDCFRELMAYVGVAPEVDTSRLPRPFGACKLLARLQTGS